MKDMPLINREGYVGNTFKEDGNHVEKEILLTWFGEESPSYSEWNVNNFKQLNPGWKVNFKHFKNNDIENYHMSDDSLLKTAIEQFKHNLKVSDKDTKKSADQLNNFYKSAYIKNSDHPCVYCDLDCFPILPFDKWFDTSIITKDHIQGHGYYYFKGNKRHVDSWFLSNLPLCCNQVLEIQDGIDTGNMTTAYGSFHITNDGKSMDELENRRDKFSKCILDVNGKSFVSTVFSPVEHYFFRERFSKNKDICQLLHIQ